MKRFLAEMGMSPGHFCMAGWCAAVSLYSFPDWPFILFGAMSIVFWFLAKKLLMQEVYAIKLILEERAQKNANK